MAHKTFLTKEDLAERWGCSASSIRNARPEDLPASFRRPGSRLVRYPLSEIEAFEKAHTAPRDYCAELTLGAFRSPGALLQRKQRIVKKS